MIGVTENNSMEKSDIRTKCENKTNKLRLLSPSHMARAATSASKTSKHSPPLMQIHYIMIVVISRQRHSQSCSQYNFVTSRSHEIRLMLVQVVFAKRSACDMDEVCMFFETYKHE